MSQITIDGARIARGFGGLAASSALLAANLALADTPPVAAVHETAVWQKHEYSFAFLGFTTTYSCDGLASKLKLLLLAAGARPDAKSQPGACSAAFGQPDKFARANLTFYTLAPSASANVAADGSPVDGTWIAVAFAYHQPRDLAVGDCELVEQFKTNVLPFYTIRNVDNRTTCVPHQESGSVIDLKFDTLAVPPKSTRPPTVMK